MNSQRRPLATPGESTHAPAHDSRPTITVTAGQIVDRLLDQLTEVLDEERRLTEEMFALAQTVQRRILADECDALLETAQDQGELACRLAQAEYARLALIRHLTSYFPELSRVRLSQWVDGLPEPRLSQLRPISAALTKAALQAQRLNRQNKALIQRSLRFAEVALGSEPFTYGGPRGPYAADGEAPRLVDHTL